MSVSVSMFERHICQKGRKAKDMLHAGDLRAPLPVRTTDLRITVTAIPRSTTELRRRKHVGIPDGLE